MTLTYATKQAPPLFKQEESFVIRVSERSGQIMNGGSSIPFTTDLYSIKAVDYVGLIFATTLPQLLFGIVHICND